MYKLMTSYMLKWARKEKITDEMFLKAISDLEKNLSSADLGSGYSR